MAGYEHDQLASYIAGGPIFAPWKQNKDVDPNQAASFQKHRWQINQSPFLFFFFFVSWSLLHCSKMSPLVWFSMGDAAIVCSYGLVNMNEVFEYFPSYY
jgi:hypothetical protein